jgi:O-methyltransferase
MPVPTETASPRNPLDLVLHIGLGLTGATAIQEFLHHNRAQLAELGYLYPRTPGSKRHTRFGLFVQPDDALESLRSWRRQQFSSPEAFRAAFQDRLFAEIDRAGLSRVLLSDEALYGASNNALHRLRRFTKQVAGSLRLVVYLRPQADHLAIRYQQLVKAGETRRLAERLSEVDLTKTYDYHNRLRIWQGMLEPDQLVVRRFERESFVDGSLDHDFLDAAGIDAKAGQLEPGEPVDESLDAESVEFLRIVNICRAENHAAELTDTNDALFARLAAAPAGPALAAPAELLDEFVAQWEQANQGVARDFLGDESGQLFRVPQEMRDTTTEQRLDPARLDHYLALAELPEQVHAPLRALAEREAKASPIDWRKERGPQSEDSARQSREGLPPHYDAAARTVIERVGPRTMTQPEKLFALILATRYVVANGIPGDIVECGVWRGGSMQAAALTLLECGDTTRDLHLYDTFEGMTAPQEVDRRVDGESAAELLESSTLDSRVWGVATLDDVRAGMAEIGYPAERIHFHPGPVEETIPREAPESAAILRLDTDWYASTRHELEHLYHRLSPGGVLIIDDYGYWEGSRKATDEFLEQTGARLLLLPAADGRVAVKPGLQERP